MASNVRFLDNVSVGSYGSSGGGGGSSESSSYALTASFAQSGNGPFTGSFTGSFFGNGEGLFNVPLSGSIPDAYQIISGSVSASISPNNGLQINSPVSISMPSGSVFSITETDIDTQNRLDFSFDQGNPLLNLRARGSSISSSIKLEQDSSKYLTLDSTGQLIYRTGGVDYGVILTSGFKNRRWADLYLYKGKRISFGNNNLPVSNQQMDIVHTENSGRLTLTGSYGAILDVKGDIEATGTISASKFTANSGSSALTPGYTFHHDSGTGLYSSGVGLLSLQVGGGGSPEFHLTTGQGLFRVPVTLNNNELYNVSRIRNLGSITGSNFELPISGSIIIDGAITGSTGVINPLTASYAITASHALNGGGGGNAFPFTGSAGISGSLELTGSLGVRLPDTGDITFTTTKGGFKVTSGDLGFGSLILGPAGHSTGYNSSPGLFWNTDPIIRRYTASGGPISIGKDSGQYVSINKPGNFFHNLEAGLEVYPPTTNTLALLASGSVEIKTSGSTVFDVIGSQGTLFSVDDDLSGTLFTANDISGLPVLEASASGEVYIGKSPQSLYTTAVISSTSNAVTQSIFGLSTSSYAGAFFDYTVHSGSNARAGSIMSIWNGSTINFTETTTTDIGDTSGFNLIVHISQSQAQIAQHSDTNGYKIKTIIRSI